MIDDNRKFRMIAEMMPNNFTFGGKREDCLWQVVMCEVDSSGSFIQDSSHNQIQAGNLSYSEAMIIANNLNQQLEAHLRNNKC